MAALGREVRFLTLIPHTALGNSVRIAANAAGVDTSQVVTDAAPDAQLGTAHNINELDHIEELYGEQKPSPRWRLSFQRRQSSFSKRVDRRMFDWAQALNGASLFCSSGLAASASAPALDTLAYAVKRAQQKRVPVAFELAWAPPADFDAVWHAAKAFGVNVLVVDVSDLKRLCELEKIPSGPLQRGCSPHDLSTSHIATLLEKIRARIRVKVLACPLTKTARTGRWCVRCSVVAVAGEEPVTTPRVVHRPHHPPDMIGGAWLGGFCDSALEARWLASRRGPTRAKVMSAARRGDLLAALALEGKGLCSVPRSDIAFVEARRRDGGANATIGAFGADTVRDRLVRAHKECPFVLAIGGVDDGDVVEPLVAALQRAGVNCVQIDPRSSVSAVVPRLVAALRTAQIHVGAAGVKTAAEAERAALDGVSYVATPGVYADVTKRAQRLGVPVSAAVATTTDVHDALRLGIRHVCLFPAEGLGGLRTVEAHAATFPEARWAAMGGVESCAERYMSHPQMMVVVVDLRSMAGGELLRRREWAALERWLQRLVGLAKAARGTASKL
eukprot:TRINITY_DN42900_c0_g1_i1.p1 TRINITY_DN42900_c0_g1~~TRINITY_DN42900_c0_g1_i1.p1  ORF type:complete len:624 (+),score=196.35 TRINITY_DN42900_c0_g1_i1:196-1872(+)